MTIHNSLTARAAAEPSAAPRISLASLFAGEGPTVLLGLLGLLLSGALAIYMLITGVSKIGAEGELMKAVQFDLALGLFTLNTAALLPFAGFRPGARRTWRWTVIMLGLYAYGAETIQILRGYDPRFSHQFHSFTEALPNVIFGIVSALIVLVYVVLVVGLFLNRRSERPQMVLALRYGVLSTLISFAGGAWMIAVGGRHIGPAGNVMWLHFIGIVGMKALFFTGLVSGERVGGSRWVHLAGIAWLVADAMVAWQTAQGLAIFTPTLALGFGILALISWGLASLQLVQGRSRRA